MQIRSRDSQPIRGGFANEITFWFKLHNKMICAKHSPNWYFCSKTLSVTIRLFGCFNSSDWRNVSQSMEHIEKNIRHTRQFPSKILPSPQKSLLVQLELWVLTKGNIHLLTVCTFICYLCHDRKFSQSFKFFAYQGFSGSVLVSSVFVENNAGKFV